MFGMVSSTCGLWLAFLRKSRHSLGIIPAFHQTATLSKVFWQMALNPWLSNLLDKCFWTLWAWCFGGIGSKIYLEWHSLYFIPILAFDLEDIVFLSLCFLSLKRVSFTQLAHTCSTHCSEVTLCVSVACLKQRFSDKNLAVTRLFGNRSEETLRELGEWGWKER